MKRFVFFFMLVALFSLQAQQRPNILIIISDDHAYQSISAYNKADKNIHTPNIDRIANQGITFNKAYVANSICGPSRACILTGKYSNKNGFTDNETSRYDSSQQQFSNLLQNAGYQTAWIGKYHLGKDPKGFDFFKILVGQGHYFNPDFILEGGKRVREKGYVTNLIENEAEKWLDHRDKNKPFCLVVGHKATHRTWMPQLEDLGVYENVNFSIPETFFDDYKGRVPASMQEMSISKDLRMGYDLKIFPTEQAMKKDGNFARMDSVQFRTYADFYKPIARDFYVNIENAPEKQKAQWKFQRYMRDYLATARSLDRSIGKMLDYLDRNQLTENTIVIYMSDQGFYMGEHGWYDKRWMYEESFRTPMVARFPQLIKAQQSSDSFVMNVDIAPTLLELAGVEIPADIQGKSFVSVLKNPKKKIRKNVFYHYYENGEHAVSPHFGVRNDRYKIVRYYKRYNGWELYDLKNDPNEMHNIYGMESSQNITRKMKKILRKEIEKYEDTLAQEIFENKKFPTKN